MTVNKKRVNHDRTYYKELRNHCKSCGIKVKEVPSKRVHDYAGDNTEAARSFGVKKIGKDEIIIDKNMKLKTKLHTLRHEIIERHEMKDRKLKYMPAHIIALKGESKRTRWEK
jgi:hypothetical protein